LKKRKSGWKSRSTEPFSGPCLWRMVWLSHETRGSL